MPESIRVFARGATPAIRQHVAKAFAAAIRPPVRVAIRDDEPTIGARAIDLMGSDVLELRAAAQRACDYRTVRIDVDIVYTLDA